MASTEKYTVLYGRLSQEDAQKTNKTDDSNSIQNQKLLLEKYAAEKGFTNTLFLYDDGYSGTQKLYSQKEGICGKIGIWKKKVESRTRAT